MATKTGTSKSETITGTSVADFLYGGGGNDRLKGLAGNDSLFGQSGNDTLDGGRGNDILTGGAGADVFIGMRGRDTFVGGGLAQGDTANYSFEYLDGATRGITVNLSGNTRAGLAANTAKDSFGYIDSVANIPNVVGTRFADTIHGGGNSNKLSGLGGNDFLYGRDGNDILSGGTGGDEFVFNTALNSSTNVDRITDFSHSADRIRLDDAIFTNLGAAGTLAAGALADWDAPDEADDRILYRHIDSSDAGTAKDTILLYYDPTGGGSSDAVLFARLTGQASVTLDFSDFLII